MRHEKLFEPVSEAEPCGPDLDEAGDGDYLNYVLPAEDRLPASFFNREGGLPDRSQLDLRAEVKTIGDLLGRSRDLRLLTLEARFQIAAGQFLGFTESLQAIAGLLSRYWTEVHPVGSDGDFTLRQNILSALDDRGRIILPLQFATILRDKRVGNISYRQYAIAAREVQPRAEEEPGDPAAILDALRREENRPALVAVHAALGEAREALRAIKASFVDNVGYDAVPNFDGLAGTLEQMTAMIEKAAPVLRKSGPAPETVAAEDGPLPEAAAPVGAAGVAAAPVMAPAVAISSQAQARAALQAAEDYFAAFEPSAPALVLVRQARLLIGKPLVAALEALVPLTAEQAIIRLDHDSKFQLDINRMRLLSGEAVEGEPQIANGSAAPDGRVSVPPAASRAEAAALISGVERYFRSAEPSSPAPMLLAKATGLMNLDFLAILKDLLTEPAAEG